MSKGVAINVAPFNIEKKLNDLKTPSEKVTNNKLTAFEYGSLSLIVKKGGCCCGHFKMSGHSRFAVNDLNNDVSFE